MPCHNRGVCAPISPNLYECLCPAGYYGENCEKCGTNLGGPDDQILYYRHNYDMIGSYHNSSYFSRGLLPVPLECPTPMGIKGPVRLPEIDAVFDRLFRRTTFKSCPLRTNLMFATFSQYLAYLFFKTDSFATDKSSNSQSHGFDDATARGLRSWNGGKFKARLINGEEYPPYLEDVSDVFMHYPKHENQEIFPKWAMSHSMFSITPFMFVMATIWLREHNRICDIIARDHPDWNDERLYQTARWIVLGELLTITTGDYFQHLAQYRLKLGYMPHLIHNDLMPSKNQMQHEFNLAFQWHQMMPDSFLIQGKHYNLSDVVFSNNRIVFEHGLDAVVDFMSRTSAGQITHHNCGETFAQVMKRLIEEGRVTRLHSFNDYRKFFGLKPYESFEELTGEEKVSKILKDLYEDVDAIEFVVGSFLEKHVGSVVPPTMILLTGPFALREILSCPIGSVPLWRPSTFGGKMGFDIVQKASLRKLFCLNLRGNCKNNVWVSFKKPANAYE